MANNNKNKVEIVKFRKRNNHKMKVLNFNIYNIKIFTKIILNH